ncbi:anthranilate synthase component I [Desulfosudis oleivorans]|uniref:Anthranilate synthase component 1 n=1 Tax=Desulfosudis oleivorans (strain DSM 6200 / JCM 39069 / Hxd3) TaxID=96561 RepID=A8ZZX3_DESOH|nr:anthranilate synthase component I [Desulfosudis oleivorans]ABW67373.1 Anthranilate synthase [Desulfosudis oleivorans Hxd3]
MILQQFPDKTAFREMAQTANTIPVCAEILADTETPVSILKKLYTGKGPIFLFESAEGGERWGRYSFLGASAKAHVKLFRDHVEILDNGTVQRIRHNGLPLQILRNIMADYTPAEMPGLPRFWGGLVGYFTYEMVSFFEKIPNRLPEDRPIAAFMIPDELIIFDNIRHTLVALAIAFTRSAKSIDAAYEAAEKRVEKLLAVVQAPLPVEAGNSAAAPCVLAPERTDEDYRTMVGVTKDYIRQGEIIQAVLSQPFSCCPAPDLWTLYRAQRYINPSPYLFFLHIGETALVGSSPETMVRLENRIATVRPIAGTRPRGRTEQEDRALADEMLKDEKERAEHLMLVDLGRNDLGRVAVTGTVQVTDLMVVERYSHVMHLVSNVRCDLERDLDAWDLLAATFPAGTLSGAPKIRAMQIIDELEKGPRGPYGGAVGYISFSGNMDLAITIRTACIEDDCLTVRAGAGIVADSDPEKERVETVNKARAIQKALELAGRQHTH